MEPQNPRLPPLKSPELRPVLVLRPLPAFTIHEASFSNRFHILKAYESPLPTHDFLQAHAQSVKVALCSGKTQIDADVLADLPDLQLVVCSSTGINQIDMAECRRRGVSVTNIGDVYSDDVADAAVGLFIDVLRRLTAGDGFVRSGRWPATGEYHLGSKVGGKKVGIVGLGNIGSKVAKRLDAMGCIISYTSTHKKHSTPYIFYSNVLKLALNSDALILSCPLTPDTRHMINRTILKALGKKGVIVNVARGAVIDEVELEKCLVEGEIAGVGLDVFENEPDVPIKLLELDNVVLSPHKSAWTNESFYDAAQLLIGNLEASFSNKPLVNLVTNGL